MTSTSSRLTGKVHNISPPQQPSDADPETELIAKVWDPILDLHGLNAPITTSSNPLDELAHTLPSIGIQVPPLLNPSIAVQLLNPY